MAQVEEALKKRYAYEQLRQQKQGQSIAPLTHRCLSDRAVAVGLIACAFPLCSSVESDSKSTRLVTVAVVQSWNPPSLAMAKEIEKMRKLALVKSPILLIDADAEPAACREMGSEHKMQGR